MNVKKLKSGKWQADWRDGGKRKRRSFPNKAAAEYFLSRQKLFDSFEESEAQKTLNFKNMPYCDLAAKYVKEHLSTTRARGNESYVRTAVLKWGQEKLFRITRRRVKQWLNEYLSAKKNKWSIAAVKKLYAYMRAVFNWGIENEIINRNPIDRLKIEDFKRVNKRAVIISFDTLRTLLDNVQPYTKRICIGLWCSGLRQGVLLALKWKQINLIERLIYVQADQDKEKAPKISGIEQDFYDVLIEIQTENDKCAPEDYVFQLKGKPVKQHTFIQDFRRWRNRLSLGDIRPHDLKHSYITRKRREGHERSIIKKQVGHSTDSMFNWYNSVDISEIQAMSGFIKNSCGTIIPEIDRLVSLSKSKNIPLGYLQGLIGQAWKRVPAS